MEKNIKEFSNELIKILKQRPELYGLLFDIQDINAGGVVIETLEIHSEDMSIYQAFHLRFLFEAMQKIESKEGKKAMERVAGHVVEEMESQLR